MIHLPINGSIPDDLPGKTVVRKGPATKRTATEETMRTQQISRHDGHPVIG